MTKSISLCKDGRIREWISGGVVWIRNYWNESWISKLYLILSFGISALLIPRMLCTSRRQTRVKDDAEARQKSLLDRKRAIKRRPYLARAACEAASDAAWGRIGARGSLKCVRESARDPRRSSSVVIGMRRNDGGIDDSLVLNVWLFNGDFSLLIKSPRLLIYIGHFHSYINYIGNEAMLNERYYWIIECIELSELHRKGEISVNCIIFLLYFSVL